MRGNYRSEAMVFRVTKALRRIATKMRRKGYFDPSVADLLDNAVLFSYQCKEVYTPQFLLHTPPDISVTL